MAKTDKTTKPASEGRGLTYGLIVFFCMFAGAFFFLRSSYFNVQEFVVTGAIRVPTEEIVARAGQDASNIFAFDLDKAQSLIETHPWIESASASRQLPHTIVLTVAERTPIAFTPVGDSIWLVDKSGRVLGEDDGTWEGLVALTGPIQQVTPGEFLDPKSYGWGLRMLACLGPVSRGKLTEISIQNDEAALILDDGCEVLLGKEKSDPAVRASILESILLELKDDGRIAERIDLRFDRPAVREQFTNPQGR